MTLLILLTWLRLLAVGWTAFVTTTVLCWLIYVWWYVQRHPLPSAAVKASLDGDWLNRWLVKMLVVSLFPVWGPVRYVRWQQGMIREHQMLADLSEKGWSIETVRGPDGSTVTRWTNLNISKGENPHDTGSRGDAAREGR